MSAFERVLVKVSREVKSWGCLLFHSFFAWFSVSDLCLVVAELGGDTNKFVKSALASFLKEACTHRLQGFLQVV